MNVDNRFFSKSLKKIERTNELITNFNRIRKSIDFLIWWMKTSTIKFNTISTKKNQLKRSLIKMKKNCNRTKSKMTKKKIECRFERYNQNVFDFFLSNCQLITIKAKKQKQQSMKYLKWFVLTFFLFEFDQNLFNFFRYRVIIIKKRK